MNEWPGLKPLRQTPIGQSPHCNCTFPASIGGKGRGLYARFSGRPDLSDSGDFGSAALVSL